MAKDQLPTLPSVNDMLGILEETTQRLETDEEFRKSLLDPHPSGNPMNIGPRLPKPEDWAKNQVKGAQDNADKWLKNTLLPKKNFKEEALKSTSRERYADSMRRVIEQDAWGGGMENVNETETMETIRKGGSTPYANGVAKREAKIQRVVQETYNDRLAIASTIDDMPTSTDAEREAKMIANKRALQALGIKRRGGAAG